MLLSRVYELSQNVYRITDTTKSGIVGCLTPTGLPYLTTRGGRIIGLEALTLQGLGFDELELNMMTQANLQDLAGNAMSATVVGATLAAALSVFHDRLAVAGRPSKAKLIKSAFELPGEALLLEARVNLTRVPEPLAVADAKSLAAQTRRLCACEGRQLVKHARFGRCDTCGHTACEQCGVKPVHSYVPISTDALLQRLDPSIFEQRIKRAIPASFSFSLSLVELEEFLTNFGNLHHGKLDPSIWDKFDDSTDDIKLVSAVRNALASDFSLRTIRRDEFWEITYESPDGRLILIVSDVEVKWSLFANLPHEGYGTKRSQYLRQYPLAIMIPDGDDLNHGHWRIWLPKTTNLEVVLESYGEKVKTFAAQRGVEDYQDEYTFSKVSMHFKESIDQIGHFGRNLEGTFILHQDCGQPFNTLHALEDFGSKPLFFYLEQHFRSGNPKLESGDHHFVFTEQQHRLEKMESRDVIAIVDKNWRPPIMKIKSKQPLPEGRSPRQLDVADSQVVEDFASLASIDRIVQQKSVTVAGGFEMAPFLAMSHRVSPDVTYWQPPPSEKWNPPMQLNSSCELLHSTFAAFAFEANVANVIDRMWLRQDWIELGPANEARFMGDFGYALLRGSVVSPYTDDESKWIDFLQLEPQSCLICAPSSPPLLWTRNKKEKAGPCEEPHAATMYEKLLKSRPKPFTAKFKIEGQQQIQLKVGINPRTLVHRARNLLPIHHSDVGNIGMQASWRFVTDDNSLPPLRFRTLDIPDNKEAYSDEKQPYIPDFRQSLRAEQIRAFYWMLQRDDSEDHFTEEEVVEARLPKLGFRLEGRVSRKIKRSGGMLFFDVGFGKTAISLALAQYQLVSDKKTTKTLITNMPLAHGKIPLKATIIFTPHHLPLQWSSEVEKFLGKNGKSTVKSAKGKGKVIHNRNVLVITNNTKMEKVTVEDFKKADIIIVSWSILTSEKYQFALAQLTGLIEKDESGTHRSKESWYEKAVSLVPETVKKLHHMKPFDVWNQLQKDYVHHREDAAQINAHLPTKRTKGKNYVPADVRVAASKDAEKKRKRTPDDAADTEDHRGTVPEDDGEGAPEDDSEGAPEDDGEGAPGDDSEGAPEDDGEGDSDKPVSGTKKKPRTPKDYKKLIQREAKFFNFDEASNVDAMRYPIFEMFHFSRIFIDEYPYLGPLGRLVVEHISARSRYGLSGTPTVDNFDSVREMGSILDVHVGIKDYSTMKAEEFKTATAEMTSEFRYMQYGYFC